PLAVADTVLERGYIKQVIVLSERIRLCRVELKVTILFIRKHNYAIRPLLALDDVVHSLHQKDTSASELTGRLANRIRERQPLARRYLLGRMYASVVIAGSCVHNHILANFTSEDRKPGGCIDPVQFRIACKPTFHRTRNVNHKNRFSCELRLCGQALEHSPLKH